MKASCIITLFHFLCPKRGCRNNKMNRITIIIFIGLFVKSTLCFSWGAKGHKIVAEIAYNFLDKNIQDSVQKYLGGMSFKDAALWMDVVSNDKYYAYLKPLHSITIEKDKTYVKFDNENIVSEIEFSIEQLKNKNKNSKEDIKMALKLLFHLIADLHQPLHVGYAEDKSGNLVRIQFDGKETNIHHVWDFDIIESKSITSENCIKIIKSYSSKEIDGIQKIDVVAWMNYTRIHLYDVYGFKNTIIDEAYINKNTFIIEKQLALAGLRLASILNMAFKS